MRWVITAPDTCDSESSSIIASCGVAARPSNMWRIGARMAFDSASWIHGPKRLRGNRAIAGTGRCAKLQHRISP